MKRFFIILMVFYFFITNAFAAGECSLWIGRSVPKSPKICKVRSIGADYMQDICNSWKIGARLEYLGSEFSTVSRSPDSSNMKVYCEPYFRAVMIGGGYNKSIGKKINLSGKSFLGCSFVHVNPKKIHYATPINLDIQARFIAELSMGIQYLFMKRFGIGFDVGYRYTPEIKPSKDIKLDFSGVTFALGLSYKI